jgi:uncharacterized membrane protein
MEERAREQSAWSGDHLVCAVGDHHRALRALRAFQLSRNLDSCGVLFGSTMAFNVWFRIWPAQQKIIRAVKDGAAPDANLVKLAGLRSRHNTYMSVPLLWAMIGQHTTFFAGENLGIPSEYFYISFLIIIIVGWHLAFQCYKKAGKSSGVLENRGLHGIPL